MCPRLDKRYAYGNPDAREINPVSYKLNKKLTDEMCKYIEEGNTITNACRLAGIDRHTHYNWVRNGKKGIRPFKDYYDRIEKAKGLAEDGMVNVVRESAIVDGNVGAAQWWLSRRYPDSWGKKERVEAKVDNSQKIEIVTVKTDDAEEDSE